MWAAALLLLALAPGDAPAPISLAPAPGAAPAASMVLDRRSVALDENGRAEVPSTTTLSAPGFRFYRLAQGGAAFYFSRNDMLITWPLTGPGRSTRADVVVKASDDPGWEDAVTFEAPVELKDGNASVRFVLASGEWDAAILVPGFAPAFSSKIAARGAPVTTPVSALKRSASVKARILSARTGKPPERWLAWVSRTDTTRDDEEARFFATRPISADRVALEFPSLPVGAWELRVEIPDGGRKRQPFTAPKPGGVTDLGDFVVPDLGTVRLTVEFPVEVPRGEITVRVKGFSNTTHAMDVDLGSRKARPAAVTVVELEQIEPGYVSVECEAAASGIRHAEAVNVEPGGTSETRFVFVPVKIHGVVKRADDLVPGAVVSSPLEGTRRAATTESDDSGGYALSLWVASDAVPLTTRAPGDDTDFVEEIGIESGVSDVNHDVLLPVAEITGVVRDAETGAPIPGADVFASTSPAKPGEEEEEDVEAHMSTRTDREGRFRLRNLVSRRIDVKVTHEGYAPSNFWEIEVTPRSRELEVRLEKGVRLHGVVTDETGSPLPGVSVGMDPDARELDFAREAVTSATGEFEFRGTATGFHVLEVMVCGHALAVRPADVHVDDAHPGDNEANIQLGPEPDVVRVRMEDDTGAPLEGWILQWTIHGVVLPVGAWQEYATTCGHPVASDADGNLLLHGLPRGTIGAAAPGSARPLGSFENDGTQSIWTIVIPKEQ